MVDDKRANKTLNLDCDEALVGSPALERSYESSVFVQYLAEVSFEHKQLSETGAVRVDICDGCKHGDKVHELQISTVSFEGSSNWLPSVCNEGIRGNFERDIPPSSEGAELDSVDP